MRATNLCDALVLEYGAYHRASRSIHEYMMRREDYLRRAAYRVIFNDTVLSGRLTNIYTIGALPVYRGSTLRGRRCRGWPYDSAGA